MKKSLLQTSLRIARDKLQDHPELLNFPHYSFIVQDNKIIEWATNARFEPPIFWGYHRENDTGFVPKYHSEPFAYRKGRGLLNRDEFEIINIRLNKNGIVKLSKPCKSCYELMRCLGCKKFYYSSDIGFLELK